MLRRLGTLMRLLCAALGLLLGVGYVVGQVFTDRAHATQYLFWIPSIAYALGLGVLTIALFALRPRGPVKGKRASGQRPASPALRLCTLAFLGVVVHAIVADWRPWRAFTRTVPQGKTLRVMHWNMTYAVPYWWDRYIAAVKRAPLPDVLILTNPTLQDDLDQLAGALGPDFTAHRCGVFGVFTRLPVLGTGRASLGIPADASGTSSPPGMQPPGQEDTSRTDFLPSWSPIPRAGSNVYDPGFAMYVRLDASATLGRDIVIWGVDLPSQPRSWRMRSARAAKATLDALMSLPEDNPAHFPPPDIILGDCNTPRGSASLDLISRGFPHAFDQAGHGVSGSWPRGLPVFHIDHVFVGPGLRAASYRTMGMGISEHLAQIAEIRSQP